MAQHDMVIDNGSGLTVRTDMNAALQALASNNAGSVEPAVKYAGQLWLDMSAPPDGKLRQRNAANTAWTGVAIEDMNRLALGGGRLPTVTSISDLFTDGGLTAALVGFNAYYKDAAPAEWRAYSTGWSHVIQGDKATGSLAIYRSSASVAQDAASSLVTMLTFTNTGIANFAASVSFNNDTSFGTGKDASNNYLSFSTNAFFHLNTTTSTLAYTYLSVIRFSVDGATGRFNVTQKAAQPGAGDWLDTSDTRIKNVLGNYEPGLDEVLQLNPVRYTFKGNDTSEPPDNSIREPNAPDIPEQQPVVEATVPYRNSMHYQPAAEGTEFVGLIAQDVEELFPGMVTKQAGFIDGEPVTDLRWLDTSELMYALVNAVKTLKAMNEALEARVAALEAAP